MSNNWIKHVKDYASKKGISYKEALKSSACKSLYKNGGSLNITDMPKDIGNEISSFLGDRDMISLRQSNALPDNEEDLNRRAHKEVSRRVGKLGKRDMRYVNYLKVIADKSRHDHGRVKAILDCCNYIYNMAHENHQIDGKDLITMDEAVLVNNMISKGVIFTDSQSFFGPPPSEAKKTRYWRWIDEHAADFIKVVQKCLQNSQEQTTDSMGVL